MADTSHPSELAHLIRSKRIVLGMSQARLGAKVDRAATTVRRWERAESLPGDDLLDDLAAALEVPRASLEAAMAADAASAADAEDGGDSPDADAGPVAAVLPLPARDDAETRLVELADAGPAGDDETRLLAPALEPTTGDDAAAPVDEHDDQEEDGGIRPPVAPLVAVDPVDDATRPIEPSSGDPADEGGEGAAAAAAVAAPIVLVQAADSGSAAADVIDAGADAAAGLDGGTATIGSAGEPWIELPTEAILAPVDATGNGAPAVDDGPAPAAAAAAPARPPPAGAMLLIEKSYVEDRWERLLYALRFALTMAALAAMALVLAWAFIELWDALGAVLDLFGEATETPEDVVES